MSLQNEKLRTCSLNHHKYSWHKFTQSRVDTSLQNSSLDNDNRASWNAIGVVVSILQQSADLRTLTVTSVVRRATLLGSVTARHETRSSNSSRIGIKDKCNSPGEAWFSIQLFIIWGKYRVYLVPHSSRHSSQAIHSSGKGESSRSTDGDRHRSYFLHYKQENIRLTMAKSSYP